MMRAIARDQPCRGRLADHRVQGPGSLSDPRLAPPNAGMSQRRAVVGPGQLAADCCGEIECHLLLPIPRIASRPRSI